MKCKFIKPDGTQCGAYAMTGTDFCYLHNPAISDEQKKLTQTRGGKARALTIAEPLPAMSLETPQDAIILLADTLLTPPTEKRAFNSPVATIKG